MRNCRSHHVLDSRVAEEERRGANIVHVVDGCGDLVRGRALGVTIIDRRIHGEKRGWCFFVIVGSKQSVGSR